ncbi:unnamed protein product [Victoria cruziana]
MNPSIFPRLSAPAMICLLLLISLRAISHPTAAASKTSTSHSSFNVAEYGAVGNGRIDGTTAFLRAWEGACRTAGAVKLIVPNSSTFLVGPLYFTGPCRSGLIHVQILGNIVAPASPSNWKGDDAGHWLSFYKVRNLIIDGTGTIDGRGSAWWDCKRRSDEALEIMDCEHVSVRDITTLNSQGVHVKIAFSRHVTVSNIKIIAPKDSPNTDGINMGVSQYVNIHDCSIKTGDDCISMLGGSSHINISRISCGPGHGISIGSLGKYGKVDTVDHIHVTDVIFTGTMNGARIKTWQGGRGLVSNVEFSNLRFLRAQNPIIIDQYYCPQQKDCPIQKEAVKIRGVSFIGALGTTTSDVAINLKCSSTVPCTDILLSNVKLVAADPGERTRAYCSNSQGQHSSSVFPRVPCL